MIIPFRNYRSFRPKADKDYHRKIQIINDLLLTLSIQFSLAAVIYAVTFCIYASTPKQISLAVVLSPEKIENEDCNRWVAKPGYFQTVSVVQKSRSSLSIES